MTQEDVEFIKMQKGPSINRPSPLTFHQLPYTEKELRARYKIKPVPDTYAQTKEGTMLIVVSKDDANMGKKMDRLMEKPRRNRGRVTA